MISPVEHGRIRIAAWGAVRAEGEIPLNLYLRQTILSDTGFPSLPQGPTFSHIEQTLFQKAAAPSPVDSHEIATVMEGIRSTLCHVGLSFLRHHGYRSRDILRTPGFDPWPSTWTK